MGKYSGMMDRHRIRAAGPGPPLGGGEKVASPPSDGEAALLRAVVTPPESICSKSSGLSSDGLL
jgi:hypothetical protein